MKLSERINGRGIAIWAVMTAVLSLVAVMWQILTHGVSGLFGGLIPGGTRVFTTQQGGIAISYPANWTTFDLPQGNHGDKAVVAWLSDPKVQTMYIEVVGSEAADMESLLSWGKGRAEKHDGYRLDAPTNVTDGGLATMEYLWNGPDSWGGQTVYHCRDVYAVRSDGGYGLVMCSEDRDWSRFEAYFEQAAVGLALEGP